MNHKILFYLCLSLIVFLSIVPQDVNSSLLSGVRFTKSGFFQHVFGYFVLSALAFKAFTKNKVWIMLAGILILGVVLEIIQYALPTRTFNIYDLLANLAGVLVVAIKILFDQIRRSIYGNY
jgi:VanZ family protein